MQCPLCGSKNVEKKPQVIKIEKTYNNEIGTQYVNEKYGCYDCECVFIFISWGR